MEKPLTSNFRPDGEAVDISAYEQAGGYEGLRKALKLQPQDSDGAGEAVESARPRRRRISDWQ